MSTTQEISQALVQEFVINAHGNLTRVQELYEQEPGMLNILWARFDETALAAASHMGRQDIAKYLLDKGAPMTICCAATLGQTGTVASYIDADPAQANARGAHGIPIMFHAATSGNTELTELLLARGGGEGMSDAVHGAIIYGHRDMVAWLLEHGADNPNAPDFEGRTPLTVAQAKGHADIAELLRQHGGTEVAVAGG